MAEATGMNVVKAVGEVLSPGVSQVLDGEMKSGILHLAGGIAGASLLGPVLGPLTWLYLGANSYSKSVTDKAYHQHFTSGS